jgi:hypothetical protein
VAAGAWSGDPSLTRHGGSAAVPPSVSGHCSSADPKAETRTPRAVCPGQGRPNRAPQPQKPSLRRAHHQRTSWRTQHAASPGMSQNPCKSARKKATSGFEPLCAAYRVFAGTLDVLPLTEWAPRARMTTLSAPGTEGCALSATAPEGSPIARGAPSTATIPQALVRSNTPVHPSIAGFVPRSSLPAVAAGKGRGGGSEPWMPQP